MMLKRYQKHWVAAGFVQYSAMNVKHEKPVDKLPNLAQTPSMTLEGYSIIARHDSRTPTQCLATVIVDCPCRRRPVRMSGPPEEIL